jgi:hypothetical protein
MHNHPEDQASKTASIEILNQESSDEVFGRTSARLLTSFDLLLADRIRLHAL